MVKTKMMSNSEIYTLGNALLEHMQDKITLPVKINFYLQKNMNTIISLAREVEQSRAEILNKYGTLNEEGTAYNFESDKVEEAQKELNDLFGLEQEVKVNMLKLDWFNSIELDSDQINAISFMIDDEDEEE